MESPDKQIPNKVTERAIDGSDTGSGLPADAERNPSPLLCPSHTTEAALVRKIDLRVIPILVVLYIAAFLDRVNISNALTMNLPKELGLTGNQPNVALTIFFIPYVLFEVPSNMLMRYFKPHAWLSACILAFGIVMLAQGFVRSYSGLLATRFFLGLAEAGIFPGCFYLISFWYKREESQKRFTVFFCSATIATAFGGLLASAIANMDGVRGLSNWRWIFILEGMMTILIGIASIFLITDFPEDVRWLTPEEKEYIRLRARDGDEDGTAIGQRLKIRDVAWFFTDLKRILGAIMYFGTIVPLYSFAFFMPTIVKTLGFSVVQTQLHSVPPVAAALVFSIAIAYVSDRSRVRFPFFAFCLALVIIGLAILMNVHHNFSAEYAALFLIAMGVFSAGPLIICWHTMNLHGHVERSVGTAWMIGFGNTGGIVATFTFLSNEAPLYHAGYSIAMGCACLGAASGVLYYILLLRENSLMKKTGGSEKVNSSGAARKSYYIL